MENIEKVPSVFDLRNENEENAKPAVPPAVINRLPRYHRYLGDLLREGKLRISSAELSRMMNVTASQIRQDLNCFGGFGQQGYGYNVKYLHGKISELLGTAEGYRAVIVGAGNLGKALASSRMFERRGVTRVALFDISSAVIGTTVSGIPVYDVATLGDFCKENHIDIGVLAVPKEEAVNVASELIRSGVKGIWNFANRELDPGSADVVIRNVHLGDSLMTLCYEMKAGNKKGVHDDGQF